MPAERSLRPPRPHVQLGAADVGQRDNAPLRLQGARPRVLHGSTTFIPSKLLVLQSAMSVAGERGRLPPESPQHRLRREALWHQGGRRAPSPLGGRLPRAVRHQAEGGPRVGLRLKEPPPLDRSGKYPSISFSRRF